MWLAEYFGIWGGFFWVGLYWNPCEGTPEEKLWVELWGLLLFFLLSLIEGLRKTWDLWIREGGWEKVNLRNQWSSWFIQKTFLFFGTVFPCFFLFWWGLGPWDLHPDQTALLWPKETQEIWLNQTQPLLLAFWCFFWIQVTFFWAVWQSRSRQPEERIPLDLWLLLPFAFYTFLWICDPSSWFSSSFDSFFWASHWKLGASFFFLWCLSCPSLFSWWVRFFPPF